MVHQAGNVGSWTRDYRYADDSNRLLSTTRGDVVENTIDYRYDTHGNMLNVANVAPAKSMSCDYSDMIHFLDLEGGGLVYYNYDAGKQRTRKRLERIGNSNTFEERIDLGGLEIYRKFKGGVLVEEIESVHVLEGQQRVLLIDDVLLTENAKLNTGLLYRYQYSNHLGSVGLELSDLAQVISYEEFHPYGTTAYQAASSQTDTPKRYRYTGKERDEETGFSYHGARYYLPWLGRWVSADPATVTGGLNLYIYAEDRPTGLIDKNGKQSELPDIVAKPRTDCKGNKCHTPGPLRHWTGNGKDVLVGVEKNLKEWGINILEGGLVFEGSTVMGARLGTTQPNVEKATKELEKHRPEPAKNDSETLGFVISDAVIGVLFGPEGEAASAESTAERALFSAEKKAAFEAGQLGGAKKKSVLDIVKAIMDFRKRNVPIDIETAKDMVKATGRSVSEDIEFKIGKTKPEHWAEYNPSTPEGENTVHWSDYLKEGKFQVTVNRDAMRDPEKVMRAIAHEVHEIEGLRTAFEASGGKMSRMEVEAKIKALHIEALKADEAAWKNWVALPKTQ
jgi:RHS repeat-associated protein